ncbi:hypothetical protein GC173_08750 [bacterium]|nr:hypothetical protein [bacterium]
MNTPPLSLWDMVDRAYMVDGVRTLILTVGKPPMVRIADEGLVPLDESAPVLTHQDMARLLSVNVEPEQWHRLEQVGDHELVLSRGTGRRIVLTVFRASDSWTMVVHL